MSLTLFRTNISKILKPYYFQAVANYCLKPYDDVIIDPPETLELCDNNYRPRNEENLEKRKARLLYQSRKRGMLENDLILSTFAHKYLNKFNEKETDEYDKLINLPSNDWDLYNWAVGKKPVPEQFQCKVMDLLKQHTENAQKEERFKQPDLYDSTNLS